MSKICTYGSTFHFYLIYSFTGHYMFIESSAPRKAGEVGRLYSERMTKQSSNVPFCLRFWYHMLGSGIGKLNLYLKTGNGKINEKLLWTLSGNQLNQWREGTAPIRSTVDYQVSFLIRTVRDFFCMIQFEPDFFHMIRFVRDFSCCISKYFEYIHIFI